MMFEVCLISCMFVGIIYVVYGCLWNIYEGVFVYFVVII